MQKKRSIECVMEGVSFDRGFCFFVLEAEVPFLGQSVLVLVEIEMCLSSWILETVGTCCNFLMCLPSTGNGILQVHWSLPQLGSKPCSN